MSAGFVALVLVAVVTPGADTATIVRHATASRTSGLAAVGGVVSGQAVHTAAVAAGLSAALEASAVLFEAVRWAGVAYLTWVAVSALRLTLAATQAADWAGPVQSRPNRAAFRAGLVTNLANPKTTLFFGSLLPQFADRDAHTANLAGLAAVVIVTSAAWYSALAVTGARLSSAMRRTTIARWVNGIFGAAFAGLAVRLALTGRDR